MAMARQGRNRSNRPHISRGIRAAMREELEKQEDISLPSWGVFDISARVSITKKKRRKKMFGPK